jgi:hypothetical protein
MDPMERPPSPSPEDARQWLQFEKPQPRSKIEELMNNPVAVLAIGVVIGVIIVSMRPIVIQAAKQ